MAPKTIFIMFVVFILSMVNSMIFADDSMSFQDGSIKNVAHGVWKITFGSPDKFVPSKLSIRDIQLNGLSNLPLPGELPFDLKDINCRITDSRCVVYVPCDEPDEEIYGFGLDAKAYRHKGLRKYLTVSSGSIGNSGAGHGPVPLYYSTKGYGVWVDTARVPFVHVARLNHKLNNIATEKKDSGEIKTTVEELYAAQAVTGKTSVVFDIPSAKGIDVYVFAGPTIKEAVQRYNLFSGGGAMPPMWGLGLKYRTYTSANAATVLNVAKTLREQQIPCDVIGLEPGWQTQAYSCSLVWSDERFPDSNGFIKQMHDMNYHLNLWEHAYIHPTSPLYDKLIDHSGDYLVWGGLVVDFADPKGFQAFADYHEQLVGQGITGFKADECDRQPIWDTTPFNYPYCSMFPSGIDGEQMTQLYGQYYQKSILSVFEKNNIRTWSDVRATGSLAAPYPFNLYSDEYGQEEYLRQLLNASFAGLLWSPEIRNASTYSELVSRLGMIVFAPQSCIDTWFVPNPLWMQFDIDKNKANEFLPEIEREKIIAKVKELVELRMSLLPYLYAEFAKYRFSGLPPVRALPIEFPDDKMLRGIENQYMFGSNLMVAPIIAGRAERDIYMPQGCNWIDFDSHKLYQGGKSYQFNVEPGQTPVFVRENSIIPLAVPVQHVDADTVFEITTYVFGDKPADFELFEDDGVSYDYEKGKFNKIKLSWDNSKQKGSVTKAGNYQGKRYEIKGFQKVEIIMGTSAIAGPTAMTSLQKEFAYKVIDGDMISIWSTGGSQKPGQWVMIDLGREQLVSGITLNCGQAGGDYPRAYEVYLSQSKNLWQKPVAVGNATNGITEINFANTFGRYIKIVQTGSDQISWWSIADLKVHIPNAADLKPDVYIGDLKPQKSTQPFKEMNVNKSFTDKPLEVSGRVYRYGIGVHANSEVVYELKPDYQRFIAGAGVDDNNTGTENQGDVVFEVYADDKLLAKSPVMVKGLVFVFDVEIPKTANQITLVVTEGNQSVNFDHADWLNAGFTFQKRL